MTTLPVRPGLNRTLVIAFGVVVLHGFALWALQSGLLRRAVELVVPVMAISDVEVPPRPVTPAPPVPAAQPPRPTTPVARPATASASPAPQLAVPVNPEPAIDAPTAVAAAAAPLPPITQAVARAAVAPPVDARPPTPSPAAPKLELPSSDADYLQNPKPAYPAMSKRLGEQGTVLVRVLIGVDGIAQQGEVQQSSNFDRLDQAALATVLKWRYVPGKRAGKPEAMWFTVPIAFVLK